MLYLEVERFCRNLQMRNYSRHTISNYAIDLRLFFAEIVKALREISWREIDQFIEHQHGQGLAATTINRRLNAIKRFFEYLVIEQEKLAINPIKPSHFLKRGRALPKKLTQEQIQRLFARIKKRLDRAMFLLMLRCGLRVSEVAALKVSDIDWQQQALLIEQGKGRKDRRLYLSTDALASLQECLQLRPSGITHERFFWNQKR